MTLPLDRDKREKIIMIVDTIFLCIVLGLLGYVVYSVVAGTIEDK